MDEETLQELSRLKDLLDSQPEPDHEYMWTPEGQYKRINGGWVKIEE